MLTLSAGLAALFACGAPDAPDTTEQEIRGGRAELGFVEVGHLRAAGELACTGTLVTRHHVLTAAHCFLRRSPSEVVFGDRAHRIARHDVHPTFRAPFQSYPMRGIDLAVIYLSEPVAEIAPARLSDIRELAGRTDLFVRSVGFGRDHEGGHGTKRSAVEWVTRIEEDSFTTIGISGSTDFGDSGGPVVLGRSIVGTTSHGFGSSVSMGVGAARSWLDEVTAGEISWAPAEVVPDPDAPSEVCERAAASLCGRSGDDGVAKRERYVASCIDSYRACGQPPSFAACDNMKTGCDDKVTCALLPRTLCFSSAPPQDWPDAARAAACEPYALARAACGTGSREAHLAECARRFDECRGRIPELVRCAIFDDGACDPSCLSRPHCL